MVSGATISLQIYDISGKIVDTYANIPVSNPGETIRFNVYRKKITNGFYNAQLFYNNTPLGNFKIVLP